MRAKRPQSSAKKKRMFGRSGVEAAKADAEKSRAERYPKMSLMASV
jgi:hypothetical protein